MSWSADESLGKVVVSEAALRARIVEMGAEITRDYRGRAPLLVGVLKGAFLFMADLARAIDLPVEFDFMAVSSYGSSTKTSGVVRIVKDLDLDLAGRDVLIVEDIVDSGLTLSYLRRNLIARHPDSVEVCALLVKTGLQREPQDLRYVGFEIPPEFVVGYGLDVGERYRNLPYLCVYNPGVASVVVRKPLRSPAVLAVAVLAVLFMLLLVLRGAQSPHTETIDQLYADAAAGKVGAVTLVDKSNVANVTMRDGSKLTVHYPQLASPNLMNQLLQDGVRVDSKTHHDSFLTTIAGWLPLLVLFGVFFFILYSMQGGGNRVMQFGKAKPKVANKDQPRVTFADVAGADEAVAELEEIKDFLAAPAKFQAMGAKIPKGVLLFGPPGTGKTLLARAVAGEAGVPFFSISGSDFVEMFVGVGASRVRDLFEQAKASAPAIVFVDEIDAVGRQRGAGLGGGHDEREQTLNQLLVEMDGFDVKTGVILIAATNRPDILDPALLRPGRFDRQIVVDAPDLTGRRAILGVHGKGKPLDDSVDLDVLARRTPGFTGADLANLMNEAALLAARHGHKHISMHEMEEAIDRVIAGPERKTRVMSAKEKQRIAYHEGGHTIVGHLLPLADPVHKVSIVSRGRALGWTLQLPTEDKYNNSRSELMATMTVLLGGRTAEELVYNEMTTGASDDIERATNLARRMVTEFGMSETLGPIRFGQAEREVFLGRDYGHQANYSEEVATRIDTEIRALVDAAHVEATAILRAHRATLDLLADHLVEKETLDQSDLAQLLGALPAWTGTAGSHDLLPPAAVVPAPIAPAEPVVDPAPTTLRKRISRSPKPATNPKPAPA